MRKKLFGHFLCTTIAIIVSLLLLPVHFFVFPLAVTGGIWVFIALILGIGLFTDLLAYYSGKIP